MRSSGHARACILTPGQRWPERKRSLASVVSGFCESSAKWCVREWWREWSRERKEATTARTVSTTLRYLELFPSSHYADLSLNQWMALTPPELVRGHLDLGDAVMNGLAKTRHPVLPA